MEEVAVEQAPDDEKEMGVKGQVNPNPKKYSVSMLCQTLTAMGDEYLGNSAGLQQKITVLGNGDNRKPIGNDAFYQLTEQARGKGLISVEQGIKHKKNGNSNQIDKGKKGGKLTTSLPNWIDRLGNE